jgi:hypothetical protein
MRLRNRRCKINSKRLARSATEIRMIKAFVPCGAACSDARLRTIANARGRANMPLRRVD